MENKPIGQFTKEELLTVIRRVENTDIPGSRYQQANKELDIRNQRELIEAAKKVNRWYEKPLGIVVLSATAALIAAYLIYRFGWSNAV